MAIKQETCWKSKTDYRIMVIVAHNLNFDIFKKDEMKIFIIDKTKVNRITEKLLLDLTVRFYC